MVFESLMVSGMLTLLALINTAVRTRSVSLTLLCIYCAAMFSHYSFRIFFRSVTFSMIVCHSAIPDFKVCPKS